MRLTHMASLGLAILLSVNVYANNLLVQVQLKTYEGEKSYSALYLVNPSGRYEKTLWLSGENSSWQEEGMPRWWKYQSRKPQALDGYTGATVGGGDRYLVNASLDATLLDQGYKLRVETSVEHQESYSNDVEIELTTDNIRKKVKGTGWVRYIRFKW